MHVLAPPEPERSQGRLRPNGLVHRDAEIDKQLDNYQNKPDKR